MLFPQDVLARIAAGEVTLAFRRWRRSPPRPGATLKTSIGVLSFDRVDVIDETDITDRDVRLSGASSRETLLASLRGDGALLRIELRRVGDDPRIGLRQTRLVDSDEISALLTKLRQMDQRASSPWTQRVLTLIDQHPETLARALADRVGMEVLPFKQRVRRLKALGLTESLEVGYRLSPRGRDALRHLASNR
jgi:hypothetical protein